MIVSSTVILIDLYREREENQNVPGDGAASRTLFKVAKFSTVFGYAGIDVDGDTAIVRTFHHKGATILENGREVVDLNREVFVLRRLGDEWKIKLYIFNTNPVQGEG